MSKVIIHVQRNIKEKIKIQKLNKTDVGTVNMESKNISDKLNKKDNDKLTQAQQNDNKNQEATNTKFQRQDSQDSQQEKGMSIRQIQQFFQQRYLGPKKNTKIASFNKLLKTPLYNPQVPTKIFKMKTPNLNIKLKQIEKIFSVQKKTTLLKRKKIFVQSENLSQFQLYLTKRDVLRQKNQSLEEMRKCWLEQKHKQEEKKLKKKLSKNMQKDPQILLNTDIIYRNQENKISDQQHTNSSIETFQKPSLLQSAKPRKKSISLLSQMNDDQYFQKKFEQKIVKNSLSSQQKFSIRSLLQPSRNKKTTINSLEFFRNQLDLIQNVAKNTIDHFHNRQKINKILYSQTTQIEEDYKTVLMSKRATPIQRDFQQKNTKSINWVLKQCQNFKKRFNIRKNKSLSSMKRNT